MDVCVFSLSLFDTSIWAIDVIPNLFSGKLRRYVPDGKIALEIDYIFIHILTHTAKTYMIDKLFSPHAVIMRLN